MIHFRFWRGNFYCNHHHIGFTLAILSIALLGALLLPSTTDAQTTTNIDNWCDAGAPWGNGRCSAPDLTNAQQQWLFETGWYLARWSNGDLACMQLPAYVQSLLGGCSPTGNGVIGATGAPGIVCTNSIFVVALAGSPFGGAVDLTVAGNVFNGTTDSPPQACDGLQIHGTNNADTLSGGDANDEIFGYGGNDTLNGEGGNDLINGGDETCTGASCNQNTTLGDTINGGAGDDTINGGNESCSASVVPRLNCNQNGQLGDTISGGEGHDLINGGDESCTGANCNGLGTTGDTINGNEGNDSINGGNESCPEGSCNSNGTQGDTINGNEGNDSINGGDESCTGSNCNSNGTQGDTINGGTGADTINGGNEFCTGSRCNFRNPPQGDTINANDPANTDDGAVDILDGGGGTNTCQSSAGDSETNC